MVCAQVAKLLLFIMLIKLFVSLMDANNISLEVVKFVRMDMNSDTIHVNCLIVWSQAMENVFNVIQIIL